MFDKGLNAQINHHCSEHVGCLECGDKAYLDEEKSTDDTDYFECPHCGETWSEDNKQA